MSFTFSGLDQRPKGASVTIPISDKHPLIMLGNAINWQEACETILPDLKATTPKGFWGRGRKLQIRIHLGAFFLQRIYDLSDRSLEKLLKENAAAQLFCGKEIVDDWHAPDHTKIETFRNRLLPETHLKLSNITAKWAVEEGIGNPGIMDIDSTIQKANITYPTDIGTLFRFGVIGRRVGASLKKIGITARDFIEDIGIREIKSKIREYFFAGKKKGADLLRKEILKEVKEKIEESVVPLCASLKELIDPEKILKLPKRMQKDIQSLGKLIHFLTQVQYFIDTGKASPDKILSPFVDQVKVFNKGKASGKLEIGRQFQIGKIGGNIMIVGECTDIEMNDKSSVVPMIRLHEELFGKEILQSFGADKGYYSQQNVEIVEDHGIKDSLIQQPGQTIPAGLEGERDQSLVNRRAGIEPMIGHTKKGGQLGQSRMKSDQSTLSAGYTSILGVNLRQIMNFKNLTLGQRISLA